MQRPSWAKAHPLLRDYYDTEWGFPVRDSAGVYERIALESFQAGLSWLTILKRRGALRQAFAGFDPVAVAEFGDDDIERLMADESVIRNRRKITAAVTNAKATVALAASGGDLAELVWAFRPDDPTADAGAPPSSSSESAALATELRNHGFVMVGPVTMYALMQAIGILEHRL